MGGLGVFFPLRRAPGVVLIPAGTQQLLCVRLDGVSMSRSAVSAHPAFQGGHESISRWKKRHVGGSRYLDLVSSSAPPPPPSPAAASMEK